MLDEALFWRLVREALSRLYEPAYTLAHPLAGALVEASLLRSAEQVVGYLAASIEELRPPAPAPLTSQGWRQYHYLRHRYVECASHHQIATELQISIRQASREHEAGLEALGGLLWRRYREAVAA